MDPSLRPFVEKIWNYHQLHHELKKSDAILVLGSHDRIVAERGAQLWLDGWAPLLDPMTFIVVQKPYMERRSYATFRKVWPEKDLVVTSPRLSLDEYLSRTSDEALTSDDTIGIMVGDLQRIRIYPEKGFQIEQEIPADVWRAYETLVAAGYDRYLVDP